MTLRVYRKLSSAMVPLAPALIKRRLKQGKEDPARVGERRGMSADVRPHGPLVWIHGASVGEVLAAAALIERLRALNMRILLTSGTVTSAAIVAKRFPADIIHQYVPYDSPRYVARFLDHWRPSLALFIESDLWPNLILSSAARRLPMVLINGRMSQRSFPRWSRMSGTISALLGRFEVCLAQSKLDAERFAALGSRNVVTTGNLKLDVPAPPADPAKLERLMAVTRGRPIIVAASTHPGEEEILLEAHRTLAGFFPSLLTVIVPRHPDRGEAIAAHGRGVRPARGVAFARGIADGGHRYLCRRHHGRTRIVLSAGADRVHGRLAGSAWRAESDRGGQARRVDRSWPARVQFRRRLRGARSRRRRAGRPTRQEALVKQLGQLLADPAAREASVDGRRRAWSNSSAARWSARWPRSSPICCNCGSKWERPMREPAFWHRPAVMDFAIC